MDRLLITEYYTVEKTFQFVTLEFLIFDKYFWKIQNLKNKFIFFILIFLIFLIILPKLIIILPAFQKYLSKIKTNEFFGIRVKINSSNSIFRYFSIFY